MSTVTGKLKKKPYVGKTFENSNVIYFQITFFFKVTGDTHTKRC